MGEIKYTRNIFDVDSKIVKFHDNFIMRVLYVEEQS